MISKYLIAGILNLLIAVTCRKKMPLLPEYCADFEASLRDFKMGAFVATVNEQYKEKYADTGIPKSQDKVQDILNDLLNDCDFATEVQEKIKRSILPKSSNVSDAKPNEIKNGTVEEAGIIDLRTTYHVDDSVAPLVIKLRHNKKACTPLGQMAKFIDEPMFLELYPKKKIVLLALGFHRDKSSGHPAINEWISLLYEDGNILDTDNNTNCLNGYEFATLMYKNKHMKEYFKK